MALAAAARADARVEIVSVDSAQVYRGMDIGTAKASAGRARAVPHHLIDILDPAERYSAARFVADDPPRSTRFARAARCPSSSAGRCSTSRRCSTASTRCPRPMPRCAPRSTRAPRSAGWPALHAELATSIPQPRSGSRRRRAADPARARGPRAQRPAALAWHTERPRAEPPPLISLEPSDRAWLHARIAERFAAMLDAGLVDEVRALRARGDLHPELPAMRAVGYRQAWAALESGDLAALPATGTAATRQLAKRQLTWLRAMPAATSSPATPADATEQVVALATALVAA
jgi:tRNA dimethylallyltransferase